MGEVERTDETLFQQTDHLQTLNEIGRVVSATLDLGTLYETIYEQVSRVMDTTQFFIALYRPERDAVELPYHREEGMLFVGQEMPHGPSITSLVIESGVPLMFADHEEYRRYGRESGLPELTVGQAASEAKIWVPLNTGNRTIGAMTVQSLRPNAYNRDDVQTLSVIASQAAVAIENARLYQQSQDNVLQMQALLRVAQMVNGSLHLEEVLDAILIGMREVMPYYLAAVLLPNYDKRYLDIVGTVGPLAEERRRVLKIPFGHGITGRVFDAGEPAIVSNVAEFPDYVPGDAGVQSEMAVPLKRGDTVIGVLDVERQEVDGFSARDLDLLTLFASQAAIAIENARLFAAQQQRVHELQTIQSIVQKLTPLHDIPAIASLISTEIKGLIEFHACRLFALDAERNVLIQIPLPGTDAREIHLHVGEGIAGWIAKHGQAANVPNALTDHRVTQIAGTPRREESIIGAPLMFDGRVQGVITLSKLGVNQFDENSLRLLEIIAGQAAIAFDRARLYQELRTEAITDPVTKLYNRRYLYERFKEERSRALRSRHPLAVIMLDIDKFKRVNDTYGHDAGDVVLEELARVIRGVVRTEDIVARHGGEEFCILLPNIPVADAEGVAERLREAIESHRLPQAAGVSHITVSVGLAFLGTQDTGQEAFTRADQAMYHVKHLGGNRVCVLDATKSMYVCLGADGYRESVPYHRDDPLTGSLVAGSSGPKYP